MRLFRSEEEVHAWRPERGLAHGETLPLDRLQGLARDWYGDRLDPDWRPRSREDSQRVLAAHGLTAAFWALP